MIRSLTTGIKGAVRLNNKLQMKTKAVTGGTVTAQALPSTAETDAAWQVFFVNDAGTVLQFPRNAQGKIDEKFTFQATDAALDALVFSYTDA